MKRQKQNSRAPAVKARRFPVKLVLALSVIVLALSFIISYSWDTVKDTDFFLIREVVVKGNNADFSYLKGGNIFRLDLKKETANLNRVYPGYKRINIARVPPGRVYVDFVERKPAAFIKLQRYFAVDDSGVLFISSVQPESLEFPVITGLEPKIRAPKPGVRYNLDELNLALSIAGQTRQLAAFKDYKIRRISVPRPADAVFYLAVPKRIPDPVSGERIIYSEDLEVKVGSGDIKNKMAFLAGLLIQGKSDIDSIKYVDLRFSEPTIKPKNDKTK
jgi:cell division septal protein FtsQ